MAIVLDDVQPPRSAGDIINGALRLIGVLAEGESPSPETSQDALIAFNQMVDSWNTERLSVFCTEDQSFLWPANQATRTLGPTGDFEGNRPILIDPSTYFVSNNVSYGVKPVNQQQYNNIAVKGVTSTYPQVMFVNMTYPNIEMTVYPVPTQDLLWHFISVHQLDRPVSLAMTLAFPPGYLRAFRYNLACELAPEFGEEPSEQVKRIAMTSKRNLKRVNNPNDLMSIPYAILPVMGSRFNIFTGTPS